MSIQYRLDIPPAQPVGTAVLGYNMQSTFGDTVGLAAAKAGGATVVRWQPAWNGVESTTDPGTYALPSSNETGLAYCGEHGIKVSAVCAFGPPAYKLTTLTIGTGGAATGAYTIPISAGSLSTLQTSPATDFCVVYNSGSSGATSYITANGRHSYNGSLISGVSAGSGTITLASALTMNLTAGQTLQIYRLLYAPPSVGATSSSGPWDPSWQPYFNYVQFVADRMNANGVSGWVSLWNEPPWQSDMWSCGLGTFYDMPGSLLVDDNDANMAGYGMTLSGLPSGVRMSNGATEKGASGAVYFALDGLLLSQANFTAGNNIVAEEIHTYHNLPEGSMWDPSYNYPHNLLNPAVDGSTNFTQLDSLHKTIATEYGISLQMIASETGKQLTNGVGNNDNRQAIWCLRRVCCSWAAKTLPMIYALSNTDTGGNGFEVMTGGASYTPKAAYTALQSLMSIVAELGGPGGTPSSVPTIAGCADYEWPLMGCGIYGANGGLLLLWQRTGADAYNNTTSPDWATCPTPPTYSAQFYLPAGYTVTSATDVLTGDTITTSLSGRLLTVDGISESPLAILTAP